MGRDWETCVSDIIAKFMIPFRVTGRRIKTIVKSTSEGRKSSAEAHHIPAKSNRIQTLWSAFVRADDNHRPKCD